MMVRFFPGKEAISVEEQEKTGLELIGREQLRLGGVQNVDVFDEEKIVLQTELGRLEIRGAHLNVTNLDVEHGTLQVDGVVDSFAYVEEKKKRSMEKKAGRFGRRRP